MLQIWIVLMSFGYISPRYVLDDNVRRWMHTLSVPWVGLLSYKESKDAQEAVAGIILINAKLAMGNAHEISLIGKRLIRKTTKAMFLTAKSEVRYSAVTDYLLHPEFDEDTLNTIALLKLEYDLNQFQWDMVSWPLEYAHMNEHKGVIYALGYTDRYKIFEQVMYKMEFVNKSECLSFYKDEGLDSKWMAPTEYECFKKKFSSEQCVFESGMALAVHHNNKWTLLGMSVLGPGCSLPARFIDFARFLPWIEATTMSTRRGIKDMIEQNIYKPSYDRVVLQKINDSSLVLRPYDGTEVIRGSCEKNDGILMYHEDGHFEVPNYGYGIYGLSIWDTRFENISCAMLTVNCLERSLEPFTMDIGLAERSEDIDRLVKAIPIPKLGQTVGPKITHLRDGPWLNWVYRPNNQDTNVTSVVFRFRFYKKAVIHLLIYGKNYLGDYQPEYSTLADYATRSRRPHSTHLSANGK